MVHSTPRTPETKARGSEVQGRSQVYNTGHLSAISIKYNLNIRHLNKALALFFIAARESGIPLLLSIRAVLRPLVKSKNTKKRPKLASVTSKSDTLKIKKNWQKARGFDNRKWRRFRSQTLTPNIGYRNNKEPKSTCCSVASRSYWSTTPGNWKGPWLHIRSYCVCDHACFF